MIEGIVRPVEVRREKIRMQRLIYTVDIDEEFDVIGESFFELLEAIVEDELGCKAVRSKLETPDEVMSKGEWEEEE
jgi:hypothetical protein